MGAGGPNARLLNCKNQGLSRILGLNMASKTWVNVDGKQNTKQRYWPFQDLPLGRRECHVSFPQTGQKIVEIRPHQASMQAPPRGSLFDHYLSLSSPIQVKAAVLEYKWLLTERNSSGAAYLTNQEDIHST
jgi:hypothetical protein